MRRTVIWITALAVMFSACTARVFAEEEHEGTTPKTEVEYVSPVPEPPRVNLTLSVTDEITLYQGQTYRVYVKQMDPDEHFGTWKSSNNAVCTVENGLLRASEKSTGSAVISAVAFGHGIPDMAKFRVNVVKPARPYKVRHIPKKIRLRLCGKKKYRIKPVISPAGMSGDVKYKSLNRKIATVNKKGVVRAKRRGKTFIIVKCGNFRKKIRIVVR